MGPEQSRSNRQLIIGLDAMEWSLVQCWAQQGKLPAFRRLMETGVRGTLRSTASSLPDTVWPALYSGQNPARFEKYFYVQYDGASGGLKHLSDDANQVVPFWDHLSRAGRRVGVVDAPKFRLSTEINGFQLSNWGAHATKTKRSSRPDTLLNAVRARFGDHPVGDCDAVDDNPRAHRDLRRRILEGVKLHGEVSRWLGRERPWDTLFCAFSAPHCAGHHFWKYQDRGHPHYRAGDPDGLAGTLEDVYKAIDREIGQTIELAGPAATVMLVAGHGMGPVYHASWSLNEILDLLGYGRRGTRAGAPVERRGHVNPWRILKMVLPGRLQYAIRDALPSFARDRLLFLWYSGSRHWRGRRAFTVPNNDSTGAVRIAVRGRDRYGLVEPGEEYRGLCREMASALLELADPVTGRPVVREVTISGEAFSGPFLDGLPDLCVLWDQSFPWAAVRSPRFGDLSIPRQDGRTGGHTPHGFVLAAGPGIPAGVELAGHSIYDIAPTILTNAGVPVPESMDGTPLATRRLAV
ncbi:MAG TPA: alkaline phosphatase family protein [Bryobacteraceae bacterium]|nr:alkaline phosphatase family protein [Bryobacteraceae bacterium]